MTRRRVPMPFTDVFTSADLAAVGVTSGALSGWRARGEVVELAPGVFLPACTSDLERARAVYASRAIALGRVPVTLRGAATIWELPLPRRSRSSWMRRTNAPAPHEVQHRGLRVPSRAWTATQLARSQSLPDALIPLDAALRQGERRDVLLQLADAMSGWSGCAGLPHAVAEAAPTSESPLESYSRGVCLELGLPRPVLQQEFTHRGQRMRVDFWWPEFLVVGEADGAGKYTGSDVVYAEKRRQAALHALGLHVVRWGWADVSPTAAEWGRGMRRLLQPPSVRRPGRG